MNLDNILDNFRTGRVIDYLRKNYPGKWKYYRTTWGGGEWKREDGLTAHYVSELNVLDKDNCSRYLYIGPPVEKRIYWR